MPKKAIIIGAGPAGLTAAYELLKRTDIKPIVLEKCKQVGGISKTIDYKGNKMDFGPHRFFSKSDRVMNWWTNIMPLHTPKGEDLTISYQNKSRTLDTGDFLTTEETDGKPPARSMLVIQRLTRIYFLRQFFAYPIQLSIATLGQLGILTTIKIVFSYLYARLFPRKPQKSLEDFMINKFGSVLYHIFFKDYTEKVWGMDCNKISADWGAQRIKGVSLSKAIIHAAKALTKRKKGDIGQKGTETSLIEQFLYPAMGAGAMWEEVARQVEVLGGRIVSNYEVTNIHIADNKVYAISAYNSITGKHELLEGDYFISTMPIQELIAGLHGEEVPTEVKEVAAGLIYRDFVYAGVLVKKMTIATPKDSWIYIQERDVKVARMQVYNNWGPYMVADPNTVWLGLEYFCTKGDAIWNMSNEDIQKLAVEELVKMDLITVNDVLDSTVNRMEKTYPAYFGTYDRFEVIQNYLNEFKNLFLVGRNGMHKYNNTDHSMLTAMVAVDNIEAGILSKENLWEINTEQEYHEEKEPTPALETRHLEKQLSFRQFLFASKSNRRLLYISFLILALEWLVFKYFYPFASYIHGDSFGYIRAAAENEDINHHMIGYSRFLRLFSVFSSSDTILTTFQFIATQVSLLLLLFTVFFFYSPLKATQRILLILILINPLPFYLSNLISSDSLFMSLSIFWLSSLIWIVNNPTTKILWWHGVLLFLTFTFRYNALVYPIISLLAIFLSMTNFRRKVVAFLLPCTLIAFFIIYTGNQYKKAVGIWQYSPFSGWQAANNAMNTLRYVDSADWIEVPAKFKTLHQMIRDHFDSTKDFDKFYNEGVEANTMYMWTPSLPLFKYREIYLKNDTVTPEFQKWAKMGPYFKEYGSFILLRYPKTYLKHFVWPNFLNYYAPPSEFLEYYNGKFKAVTPQAASWFKYKSIKIRTRVKDPKNYPIEVVPILTGMMNVLFVCSLVALVVIRGFKTEKRLAKSTLIVFAVWLLNAVFTIISSPAAIRLQAFPIVLESIFAIVLIDRLLKLFMVEAAEQKAFRKPSIQTSIR